MHDGGGQIVTTVQETRGGFLSFLTTVPGILTAVAAVITAVTGGVVYLANGSDSSAQDNPNIVIVPQSVPDAPTGNEPVLVDTDAATGLSPDDPVQAMIDACDQGDPGACAWVLETLAQQCYESDPLSCDVLYVVSPVGSDYEWYGGTCGGYFADLTYAGTCSEL